jgi:hypothetical protein
MGILIRDDRQMKALTGLSQAQFYQNRSQCSSPSAAWLVVKGA